MRRVPACVLVPLVLTIATPAAARAVVVVELFESQGCSSCPPANSNLATVADRRDVIALNYSVTYWDHLGWKDTFAQPKFTLRQIEYAHALGHPNVFTPQVVIDGSKDGVGIDRVEFDRLVESAPKLAGPTVLVKADAVTLGGGAPPKAPADVWLVRYDPRTIQVAIGRGENTGKTLPHRNVVRDLVSIGRWTGAAETLAFRAPADPAWRTAILVQAPKAGPILAAAKDR